MSVNKRLVELEARVLRLEDDVQAARDSRDRTEAWYAARIERIKELAKEKGFWDEVACILANGTASTHEPPSYSRQLAVAEHRVKEAEMRARHAEQNLKLLQKRMP